MVAISRELARIGVPKSQLNTNDGYAFRGIDDVMRAVAPLLVKHRVCVFPRQTERSAKMAGHQHHVAVRGAFDFVSASDGSCHSAETFGEAIDRSDKATSKAMTAAYKSALVQTFCIPVLGGEDADRHSPGAAPLTIDPVQGWEGWSRDLITQIEGCSSVEAVQRVQQTYVRELRAMAAAKRPEYAAIGCAVQKRKSELDGTFPKNIERGPAAADGDANAHKSKALRRVA